MKLHLINAESFSLAQSSALPKITTQEVLKISTNSFTLCLDMIPLLCIYLLTPQLEQNMTQGQLFKQVSIQFLFS